MADPPHISPSDPYSSALEFLYELRWLGIKLGLENTRRLAELMGNPQDKLHFIHVAGTNGKGSTCAILESIYRAAGYRVGLFASPHLVSFRERLQVNRQWISRSEVIEGARRLREFLALFPPHQMPTFFEVVAVLALDYFAQAECDIVMWETGMGGRLDATNIVTPLCSVITNVQFDHQQWLGNTLAEIAAEKAGIIKPGAPVVSAADASEARDVIQDVARRQGAKLIWVAPGNAQRPPLSEIQLPLQGQHQRLNAAMALAVAEELQGQLPVPSKAIERGLRSVELPGRFQILKSPKGNLTILDGAHNPAGARALRLALDAAGFSERDPTLILGAVQEKDWAAMCQELLPIAQEVILVPLTNSRGAAPSDLLSACRQLHPGTVARAADSVADALAETESSPLRVIAGSLYLVGEALDLLEPPREAHGDRGVE